MLTFAWHFASTFIGVTLLASGAGHLVGFGRFRSLILGHGVVPAELSAPVAALVTGLELTVGGLALSLPVADGLRVPDGPVFAACAVAGLAYFLYLRALLKRPVRVASCGCTPFASGLTPASLVPSVGLIAASVVGLTASGLGPPTVPAADVHAVHAALPTGWGVTLALIVLLYPAAVPAAAREGPP
jgi:hypothetical protein